MGDLRIPWIFLSVEVTLQLHPTIHKTSYNPSTPQSTILIILQCQNAACLQTPLQFSSESTRPRSLPCPPPRKVAKNAPSIPLWSRSIEKQSSPLSLSSSLTQVCYKTRAGRLGWFFSKTRLPTESRSSERLELLETGKGSPLSVRKDRSRTTPPDTVPAITVRQNLRVTWCQPPGPQTRVP